MSNGDRKLLREGARDRSYGQDYRASVVDLFGVWLSARQICRYAGSLADKELGDFGCGYHAAFVRRVLPELKHAVVVDFALSPDLKCFPNLTAIEGILPIVLTQVPSSSLDIVLCISVLEHLWDPLTALQECLRIVRPGGTCVFNVPSWRGKRFLEYSAFRLGLSPKDEMDDHKAYYDVRDFWPLLVRAGFRPSNIRCFSHKFGLNTFAVCRSTNDSTNIAQ
ncbi:MAG TPA: methyltransferase domain-containing protein [Geobacterales bacterium]|nr:methyltransferase domain-containing protein [Geobacterales bacterium]